MTDFNNDKSLIITNLDPRVTEDALEGIFSLISPIVHIKITKDNSNVSIKYSHFARKKRHRGLPGICNFSHLNYFVLHFVISVGFYLFNG